MSNAPDTRKTHVIRIAFTNKAGEVLSDKSIDVERIDVAKSATQDARGFWQALQRKLRWMDDPDGGDYREDGPESRETEIVKVFDPEAEDDPNDPEEWAPVHVIKGLRSRGGASGDQNYQDRLLNDDLTAARKVTARRIVHCDTNIDDDAQAAFDADPNRKVYVVAGNRYTKDVTTKDESQYVEYEIIESLKPATNERNEQGDVDRGQQIKLLNKHLIDESQPAKQELVGIKGFNPPFRLDPYQNIVNVQFAVPQRAAAGIFQISHAGEDGEETTLLSDDGAEWQTGFGPGSGAAASGLGYTVFGTADMLVAFGKPKKAAACFIAVQGVNNTGGSGEIRRGVLDDHGNLQWSAVGTLPLSDDLGGAYSCSFAGEAFFISYKKAGRFAGEGQRHTKLAVSFDGQSFQMEIDPFPGVDAVANPEGVTDVPDPSAFGGCVAYDKKKKRYVTAGYYTRWYTYPFFNGDVELTPAAASQNFMAAVSADGLSWSPYFDLSESTGHVVNPSSDIASAARMPSSVCYGKGLFVAASTYQNQVNVDFGTDSTLTMTPACAVAVSADGRAWVNLQLPGSISSLNSGGNTAAVAFIKSSGSDGFFVASGTEFVSLGLEGFSHQAKIWMSEDGHSWALVHSESEQAAWIISNVSKRDGKLVSI